VSAFHFACLFAAGMAAGCINVVVGSGSLITFPTLLALGYPPVLANVTNTVGVFPGSFVGAYHYRRELRGQWHRAVRLGGVSVLGSALGCVLLLTLPSSVFDFVVPILVLTACVLVVVQPALARRVAERRTAAAGGAGGPLLTTGVLACSTYGGYFGAAQGVILLALLGSFLEPDMQRVNALKNVLAGVSNFSAGVVFAIVTDVSWPAAAAIAVGSLIGGQLGAPIAKRLPPLLFRIVIVVVGIAAILKLVT
jgi:uncharacterized protein